MNQVKVKKELGSSKKEWALSQSKMPKGIIDKKCKEGLVLFKNGLSWY